MTEPLAHKLVMAAQNASEDCGCGPNESAIVVAVLRELGNAIYEVEDRCDGSLLALARQGGTAVALCDALADQIINAKLTRED